MRMQLHAKMPSAWTRHAVSPHSTWHAHPFHKLGQVTRGSDAPACQAEWCAACPGGGITSRTTAPTSFGWQAGRYPTIPSSRRRPRRKERWAERFQNSVRGCGVRPCWIGGCGSSRSPSPPDETGGLGERTDQLNRCQSGRTFSACGPFWPCTISNSTRWFSSSER